MDVLANGNDLTNHIVKRLKLQDSRMVLDEQQVQADLKDTSKTIEHWRDYFSNVDYDILNIGLYFATAFQNGNAIHVLFAEKSADPFFVHRNSTALSNAISCQNLDLIVTFFEKKSDTLESISAKNTNIAKLLTSDVAEVKIVALYNYLDGLDDGVVSPLFNDAGIQDDVYFFLGNLMGYIDSDFLQ